MIKSGSYHRNGKCDEKIALTLRVVISQPYNNNSLKFEVHTSGDPSVVALQSMLNAFFITTNIPCVELQACPMPQQGSGLLFAF